MTTRPTLTILVISFAMWAIAGNMLSRVRDDIQDEKPLRETAAPFLGWAFLTIVLVAGSDNAATAEISESFAVLIAIATFMNVGYDGFNTITKMLGGTIAAPNTGAR